MGEASRMKITPQDRIAMAVRCGLDPLGPERNRGLIARAVEAGHAIDWGRQTGRTTLVLLSALVAAEREGTAFVMVPTYVARGVYQRRVDELADRGGVRFAGHGVVLATNAHELRGFSSVAVFCDPDWHEFAPIAERLELLELERLGVARA